MLRWACIHRSHGAADLAGPRSHRTGRFTPKHWKQLDLGMVANGVVGNYTDGDR